MHTHSPQRGFTLLEIMIAVAVVAILAAIALPSYNNYSVRSRVSECVSLATTAKLAVNDRVMRNGEAPSSSDEAGFDFSQTEFCDDIRVADGGTIVVETQNTGAVEDPVVQLRLDLNTAIASVSWDCEYVSGDPAHVPSNCRALGVAATGGGSTGGSGSGGSGTGGSGTGGSGTGGSGTGGDGSGGDGSGGDGDFGDGDSDDGDSDDGDSDDGDSGDGDSGDGDSGDGDSDDGDSDDGDSDDGDSDDGDSDDGDSDEGDSDDGNSDDGDSDDGDSDDGDSDDGDSDDGDSDDGDSDDGDSDDGDSDDDGPGGGPDCENLPPNANPPQCRDGGRPGNGKGRGN